MYANVLPPMIPPVMARNVANDSEKRKYEVVWNKNERKMIASVLTENGNEVKC
jgi:hypothetical protein